MIKAYKYIRYDEPFNFHDPYIEEPEIFIPQSKIIIYNLNQSYPRVRKADTPTSSPDERISDLITIEMTEEDVVLIDKLYQTQNELNSIQRDLSNIKNKY